MKFASEVEGERLDLSQIRVSAVLRIHANRWDRGKFECQVSFYLLENLAQDKKSLSFADILFREYHCTT